MFISFSHNSPLTCGIVSPCIAAVCRAFLFKWREFTPFVAAFVFFSRERRDKSRDKSIRGGGTNPPTEDSLRRPRTSSARPRDITSRPHTGVLLTMFCAICSYVGTFALHNSLGAAHFDRVFIFGTAACRDIIKSKSFRDIVEHLVSEGGVQARLFQASSAPSPPPLLRNSLQLLSEKAETKFSFALRVFERERERERERETFDLAREEIYKLGDLVASACYRE